MESFESTTAGAPPGQTKSPGSHPAAPRGGWAQRERERWTWEIRSEWAELLDAPNAPDFANLQADPRAELIKANDGRQVWRLDWGQHSLFVKVCRPGRKWAWVRKLLFGADAVREKSVADYAAEHGVDTVTPIAVATAPFRRREPVSILITLGLPHAIALNEFWDSLGTNGHRTREARNQVIDATARLIAQAHENGFEHTDLHAGNVLIQANGEATYRAMFVDLLNIRTGRPVTDQGTVRNLAQLNQWFRSHAPLTDRIRFLNRYLTWRKALRPKNGPVPPMASERRRLLPGLERAVIEHANALYSKRDRRALRTGRYFSKLRLKGGWQAHVFLESKHAVEGSALSQARFTADEWREWLRSPEDWTRAVQRQYVIKHSPSSLVYRRRLENAAGAGMEVICKRPLPRNPLKRLLTWVGGSRAMRTWRLANALLNRQIPTARPLAVVEKRRLGRPVDAFLLTECIEQAHDLDALLTMRLRELDEPGARRLKQQIIDTLVPVLRRLHERGFAHRDLKAPNVMVHWDGDLKHRPHVLLVDLDGIRRVRRCNPAMEARALARLSVSLEHCRRVTRTDRLRFLMRYLARPSRPEPQWRPTWMAIQATAQDYQARKGD